MKKTILSTIGIVAIIVLGTIVAQAAALGISTAASIGTSSTATGGAAGANASVKADLEVKAQDRAAQEIDRRVTALTSLATRISAMVRVSDQEKSTLQSSINSQISMLDTLKAKIAADTDAATLKADVASITKAYRIFILVMPQGRIAAAADRISTTADLMTQLGAKLQTRMSDAANAGHDITALQSTYSDYMAKIADAKAQATTATNLTANLTPDNGDATVAASNKTALTNARSAIKTAVSDLQKARTDATTIVKTLKGWAPTTGTSTSTSASSQSSV
ncbi:MAG TPA: hypothetical protein VG621_02170 [Candidatus Paceibacterota bacterium]|nr:hypothetical protein [Candidatus Paceibacterota bacterium]